MITVQAIAHIIEFNNAWYLVVIFIIYGALLNPNPHWYYAGIGVLGQKIEIAWGCRSIIPILLYFQHLSFKDSIVVDVMTPQVLFKIIVCIFYGLYYGLIEYLDFI